MARRSNAELSEATRRILLAEARSAFATHGYADAPIEPVVAAAGLTKGALYHHFGSKRGLFEAVLRDLDAELMRAIEARLPHGIATLDELLQACGAFLEATLDPGVRRILLLDAPAVLGYHATRSYDAQYSIAPIMVVLDALGERAAIAASLDREAMAHLIAGALYEAALWIGESKSPRRALERATGTLAALLTALAAKPAPGQPRSTGSTSIDQRTRRASRKA
jgi:AcrR family transcriptional regulator